MLQGQRDELWDLLEGVVYKAAPTPSSAPWGFPGPRCYILHTWEALVPMGSGCLCLIQKDLDQYALQSKDMRVGEF